jgi:multidrug/microcin transport system ATP-binding/permease protein
MRLLRLMLQQHRAELALSLILSLVSAGASVGVLAFINERLLVARAVGLPLLGLFAGLLALLFVLSTLSQVVMSRLGHNVVYGLRRMLVKRVLDTDLERIETLGAAKLLASLSSDTSHISTAFLSLPHAVYGCAVCLGAFGYLGWLSLPLLAATLGWILLTIAVAYRMLLATHRHFDLAREVEDDLVADYQAVIGGRKELALNRARARVLYEQDFEAHARRGRDQARRADLWNSVNDNFVTVMALAAIGLCFFLADGLGWADTATAATYGFTILFLGAPLASVVGSVPALLAGDVALNKVSELELSEYTPEFEREARSAFADFERLELREASYRYPAREDEAGFEVGPLNWTLRRGELVFVIGGNGSGKSTLARLLSGLCEPRTGEIAVDGVAVEGSRRRELRALFSAVFSDFHLFKQLLGVSGPAPQLETQRWLATLALAHKVQVRDARLSDLQLSAGQRKRLALLLALLEERPILLLDEWAADQDPSFRRTFYLEVLPMLRAAGRTIVAVTHDESYFHVADRVIKLEAGQLVEDSQRMAAGAPDALPALALSR